MDTLKFKEEIKALEYNARKELSHSSKSFPLLMRELYDNGKIDKELYRDLEKLWRFRNKIILPTSLDDHIPEEVQFLLARIVNNFKLE